MPVKHRQIPQNDV